jgi:hypothetical protein
MDSTQAMQVRERHSFLHLCLLIICDLIPGTTSAVRSLMHLAHKTGSLLAKTWGLLA